MWYKLLFFFIIILFVGCTGITVEDITFTLNPSVDTVMMNDDYVDPGASAVHNQTVFEVIVIENTVNTEQVGDYQIVYQIEHNNQTRTLVRKVSVIEEVDLTLRLNPGRDTIRLGEPWQDAGVDTTLLDGFTVTVRGTVNTLEVGTYTIDYIAENDEGLRLSVRRIVKVIE